MMAIGVLSSDRLTKWAVALVLVTSLGAMQVTAEDQLKLKNGTVVTGQIVSVSVGGAPASDGQIMFSSHTSTGGVVKLPYFLTDIDTITMATPAAVTQVQGAAPAAVVAALEPQVKQFAGLPVDWVVTAMGALAEAYSALGQDDKANGVYSQINALYPGSKYRYQAVAGQAKIKLQHGDAAGAQADLQPIIDEADKNLAPSQIEGGLYATAFLVYGQALEAQKKPEQALEAYLTVKTMFYQNPTLAEQSDQLAKKLRDQNPGVGVE